MTTKLVRATLSLGLAAFVLLIAAGTGWTQVTTGDIRGRVLDTGQQPIEGVQISVTDTRTNTTTGTITNADGRYTVRFLRPGGPFTVTAQSIGYRTVSRTGVAVTLSQAASVDFQLETSAVEVAPLTVAVAGTDAVISKTHTGAQTTVGQKEITDFPTFERQLNEYAILSPYSNVVEGQPSIAGQNNRYNNIQIDGAVNNDVFGLADSGVPGGQARAKPISLLAVEEIQILVSPFDVRQGYFSGGLLNAVTKSGGDTWKGSAFGQGSNNSLVVPFEGTSLGDFDDTQFGAELGGPIIPGKLFFYGAGEGQITTSPTDEGVNLGTSTTPDPEFGFSPAEATEFAAIMEQVYGVDAGTTATISLDNPRTNIFARFDIYPSDKHRIVARWNYSRARDVLPPFRESFSYATSSNIAPFLSNTNSVVLNWFGNFSEKWNNELLINFETVRDNRDPDVDWGQVEVDVTNNTLVAGAERFSQVNLLNQDVFQLTDNVTGIFGSHEITFGTSNQFWSFTNDFQPASIGVWTFDSLDDLAANNPSSYVRRVPLLGASPEDLVSEFSAYQLGFYFQDGWTVSDAFTLNYGLRVDIPILPDKPFTNPPRRGGDLRGPGPLRVDLERVRERGPGGRPHLLGRSRTGLRPVRAGADELRRRGRIRRRGRAHERARPGPQVPDGLQGHLRARPGVRRLRRFGRAPVHVRHQLHLLRGDQPHPLQRNRSGGRAADLRHARCGWMRVARTVLRGQPPGSGDGRLRTDREPHEPERRQCPRPGVRPDAQLLRVAGFPGLVHVLGRQRPAGAVLQPGHLELRPEPDRGRPERPAEVHFLVRAPAQGRDLGHRRVGVR
ncbi:MAG: carboxypeptidase regulatory-like domain-containing protein [Gemmatimonadales bacterium]